MLNQLRCGFRSQSYAGADMDHRRADADGTFREIAG